MRKHLFQSGFTAALLLLGTTIPAAAQTEAQEHDAHHPGGTEAPAAPAETGDFSAEAPASDEAPAPAAASEPDAPTGMAGTGKGMMTPEMMEMMEHMMTGRMPGRDAAPLIIMVPMPMAGGDMMTGCEMGKGMMMQRGLMSMMQAPSMGANPGAAASIDMSGGRAELALGVVTPAVHLSAADVRHYLEHRLDSDGNPRLAIGEVTETDDDIITAEVVTTDGSLVERLSIDRHSGRVARAP